MDYLRQLGQWVTAVIAGPLSACQPLVDHLNPSIKLPADLKGEVVSHPSSTALAACIMPQYFLHTHGTGLFMASFQPADDASHDVVASYVKRFEQGVRPVERP